MILAQNHLLPLNGSKILLFLVVFSCLLASCNTKKKGIKSSPNRPTTQVPRNTSPVKSKVDTIDWVEEKLENTQGTMTDQPTEIKSSYNLALCFPFDSDGYTRNNLVIEGTNEFRFANYYAGVKMALRDLESNGAKLNITVIDSESGNYNDKLKELGDMDVIIGPYNRNQLKETAKFCNKNEIVNISPWQASSRIAEDNPFHVQLRPNQTAYYDAMVMHALELYSPDQITMLGRNNSKDKARIDHFQKTAAALKNLPENERPLHEYFIDPIVLNNDSITYKNVFQNDKTNIFIFPQWSGEDESFIYDCLRKLTIEKGENNIIVYGMPVILDSEKITFDYFQNLNIKIARAKWVDRKDDKVKNFRSAYFAEYNALPSDDALDGYDMMNFIATNLIKDGKTFQYTLDQDRNRYLQTKFDIQKVIQKNSRKLDSYNNIGYFENRNLDIIYFDYDRLTRDKD